MGHQEGDVFWTKKWSKRLMSMEIKIFCRVHTVSLTALHA